MRSAQAQQPGALVGCAAHTGILPGWYLRRRGVASSTRERESAKPTPEERRPGGAKGARHPARAAPPKLQTDPLRRHSWGCRSRDLVRA